MTAKWPLSFLLSHKRFRVLIVCVILVFSVDSSCLDKIKNKNFKIVMFFRFIANILNDIARVLCTLLAIAYVYQG